MRRGHVPSLDRHFRKGGPLSSEPFRIDRETQARTIIFSPQKSFERCSMMLSTPQYTSRLASPSPCRRTATAAPRCGPLQHALPCTRASLPSAGLRQHGQPTGLSQGRRHHARQAAAEEAQISDLPHLLPLDGAPSPLALYANTMLLEKQTGSLSRESH